MGHAAEAHFLCALTTEAANGKTREKAAINLESLPGIIEQTARTAAARETSKAVPLTSAMIIIPTRAR